MINPANLTVRDRFLAGLTRKLNPRQTRVVPPKPANDHGRYLSVTSARSVVTYRRGFRPGCGFSEPALPSKPASFDLVNLLVKSFTAGLAGLAGLKTDLTHEEQPPKINYCVYAYKGGDPASKPAKPASPAEVTERAVNGAARRVIA